MKAVSFLFVILAAAGAQAQSSQAVNETDTSVCRFGAPATSIEGRWQMVLREGGFRLTVGMEFRQGVVNAANTCQYMGRELTARVSSTYSATPSSFTIHSNAQRTESINEGGFNMNCNVNLNAATLGYRPEGSCIRLIAPPGQGPDLIMVPAR